tara:strand:+ start:15919 stop:16116 length:198 start_codon:yes stop_codon:yes gene_type:complete
MTKKFLSKAKVQGSEAGQFTMTEDSNQLAKNYKNLIKVVLKNEDFLDAYYFVEEENADKFINPYL